MSPASHSFPRGALKQLFDDKNGFRSLQNLKRIYTGYSDFALRFGSCQDLPKVLVFRLKNVIVLKWMGFGLERAFLVDVYFVAFKAVDGFL